MPTSSHGSAPQHAPADDAPSRVAAHQPTSQAPASGGAPDAAMPPISEASLAGQALVGGTLPAWLQRTDAATSQRVVVNLQRTSGNGAVQQLVLQRSGV